MPTNLHTSVAVLGSQPTAQQALLLRAALQQGDAAKAAWRAWRVNADLDQLPPGGFGLLPLLAYNLQKHGVNDSLLDKCQGIHRRTWTQNQLYLRQVAALAQSWQQANVTPVWQGDMVLALAYYPAQGLRMIQQAQFVTPASQATAVQMQLAEAHWHPLQTPKAWLRQLMSGGRHPQRFRHPESDLALVWQLASLNAYPPLAPDLWQRAQPLTINGVDTAGVSATDLLYAVCLEGISAFWRFGAIQWLVDATMLLRTITIDWAKLLEQTAQHAFAVRMTAALQGLQQWVEAAIPPDALSALTALSIQPFERWEAHCYQRLPPTIGKGGALWSEAQRRRWLRQC